MLRSIFQLSPIAQVWIPAVQTVRFPQSSHIISG